MGNYEVEIYLQKKFEGKLFVHISMTNISGDIFIFNRIHYTVLNGVVYELNGFSKYASGESCLDIEVSCKRIGIYNSKKEYKWTKKKFKYSELKMLLRL